MTAIASTVASSEIPAIQTERAFFFYMALALLATAVAGFGNAFRVGFSTFASPWWVHVHAVSMGVWVLLYVAQNWLVYRGHIAGHRQLGVFAAAWSVWLFVQGVVVAAWTVEAQRFPPVFETSFFLVFDWLSMAAFGTLAWTALSLRTRPDWHKRLMLGAMIVPLAPAWGRLMPWGQLIPQIDRVDIAIVVVEMLILLGYFGVAMLRDRFARGSVHPAYWWGAGTLIAVVPLSIALAPLPPIVALAERIAG